MLDVGLIGLGPDWETCYRQVLQKLRGRMRIRSVYSTVSSRADQVAAEFACDASIGLFTLVERPDLQALLLLDTAWFEQTLIEFACRNGKPVYVGGQFGGGLEAVRKLHSLAAEKGITLMPQFRHRYLPVTVRLQELIASRLGRPLKIIVDASLPANDLAPPVAAAMERDLLVELIDWCHYLMATPPSGIESISAAPTAPDEPEIVRSVMIDFRRKAAGGDPTLAHVRLRRAASGRSPNGAGTSAQSIRRMVECTSGRAELEGPTQIIWEQSDKRTAESLVSERSEVEVMLDHFCRRVVGGLIPVPTLEDVCDILRLVEAAEESRRSGKRVELADEAC